MKQWIVCGVLVLALGCHGREKKAAAQKQLEAQVEQRATQLASEQAQQLVAQSEERQNAAAQHAADARAALRNKVLASPADFVDIGEVQVVTRDGYQQLVSVALTNHAEFAMTNLSGALDLHGDVDHPGGQPGGGDVVATVPVALTGSIAPGASMRFSAREHTLAATPVKLAQPPSQSTFRVTAVQKVAPVDDGSAAAASGGAGL